MQQQDFLISANSFVQRAGIAALSKDGDEAVARMRAVYDKRRKLMVELMREVGFGIPVMPQGAFYVCVAGSRWTDDSYKVAFELLEKAGVGVAPGVDFGQAGKRTVRFSYASSEHPGGRAEARGVSAEEVNGEEVRGEFPYHRRSQ